MQEPAADMVAGGVRKIVIGRHDVDDETEFLRLLEEG
mgnify:CR=1 FL=1